MRAWNQRYPYAEYMVVDHGSRLVHGNRHTFACADPSTGPTDPYRRQKGRTRWDGLESTMGPDHRESAAARNAFFPGSPGRASILPAFLRDAYDRQTHILGLLLPGACRCRSRTESKFERPSQRPGRRTGYAQ